MIARRGSRIVLGVNKTSPLGDHTVPSGTDPVCRLPRHFMPGYLHLVPSGQRADSCPQNRRHIRGHRTYGTYRTNGTHEHI
jgi:hypothetical protein